MTRPGVEMPAPPGGWRARAAVPTDPPLRRRDQAVIGLLLLGLFAAWGFAVHAAWEALQ